ncbi:major capsid protein [Dyella soli]|uniref:Methyltransferase n=1 Tax=Dyella soli TaxID=522319 RepID=A0A4R0YTF8_9GAMM|nr:major capsid protein [Dyella soli]TCI10133.1 hypothetical protein EZM97_14535 [Dyella soli]
MHSKAQKFLMAVRNNRTVAALMVSAVAAPAFAQAGTIDTSSVVATITSGLAAIAAIGAAWVGFKYLKKVWNRI